MNATLRQACDVPVKQSQVQAGLDDVSAELDRLRDVLAMLEQRLCSVLIASPPKMAQPTAAGNPQSTEAMCPVGERLHGFSEHLRALREMVNDVIQRCEC